MKPIIMDGAMGTYLKEKGIKYDDILKSNLTSPNIVKCIHEEYIKAGAEIISTNTFTALSLLEYGKKIEFESVLNSALKIAWDAKSKFKNKNIKLALDFGPLSNVSYDKLVDIYEEAFKIIVHKSFDYLIIETQYNLKQTLVALEKFKEINKPILLSFTFNNEGKLYSGENIEEILIKINKRNMKNLIAIGANCSSGAEGMIKLVDEFKKHTNLPIIMKPNLGMPKNVNGKLEYNCNLDTFKNDMNKIKEKGATFLGGCCGTKPQYIKAIASL